MKAERPALSRSLDSRTFREYYWLKEELTVFCREHHLPVSGGKQEITERIALFLDTGEIKQSTAKRHRAVRSAVSEIQGSDPIEEGFVCTEAHRAFFRQRIGPSFTFNEQFQKWLKTHAGKTCDDAVSAYAVILREKKKGTAIVGKQFEYNAYIRDFFADNAGRSLADAVRCWKYKKGLPGHNRYEESDLSALEGSDRKTNRD